MRRPNSTSDVDPNYENKDPNQNFGKMRIWIQLLIASLFVKVRFGFKSLQYKLQNNKIRLEQNISI